MPIITTKYDTPSEIAYPPSGGRSVDESILITGATGLVGSHLAKELIQRGQKVKALYRTLVPKTEWANQVEWIQGDILDTTSLEEAMYDITHVYHAAAIVSFNPKQKQLLHITNIDGTANVVNACLNAGVQKLLYVSSVSALGRIREKKLLNETMHWIEETSNSEYGKTKFFAEMEVWRGIGEGLNAVIVNPSVILGVADWNKGSAALFKNAYNEFSWYTEGVTGFVDVTDVVMAMILLMQSDVSNERFILSAENITYHKVFNLITKAFEKKAPHKKATPFLAEIVWRYEAIKALFTGKNPLLTKETALTAQAEVYFENSKLLKIFPDFKYNSIENSIERICTEFKSLYLL